jgi:hypothetical protein
MVVRSTYAGQDAAFSAFSQCDGRWISKPYARTGKRFRAKACALTTLTAALAGHGIRRTPEAIHDELMATDAGFASTGDIVLTRVVPLLSGNTLRFHEAIISSRWQPANARAFLDDALINQRRAVIVGVDPVTGGRMHHSVLVVGKAGDDYLISDVGYPDKATLRDWGDRYEIRGYIEPASSPAVGLLDDHGSPPAAEEFVYLHTSGVAEPLLVDAAGRQCGRLGEEVVNEIPSAVYYGEAYQRTEEGTTTVPAAPGEIYEHIHLRGTLDPTYRLILTGKDDAPYTVRIYRGNAQTSPAELPTTLSGTIRLGQQVQYTVSSTGPQLSVVVSRTQTRLSWSNEWADWRLEASDSVVHSAWRTVSWPRELDETNTSVAVEMTDQPQFFRLVKP